MKTPDKVPLSEFLAELKAYLDPLRYEHDLFWCGKCGQAVKERLAHISLHCLEMTECAGTGRVIHIYVPYCPGCEVRPNPSGCVHVPMLAEIMRRGSKAMNN